MSDHTPHVGNLGRTPFSPKWGIGGFSWRCSCGAKSRRRWPSHNSALLAWDRHTHQAVKGGNDGR